MIERGWGMCLRFATVLFDLALNWRDELLAGAEGTVARQRIIRK